MQLARRRAGPSDALPIATALFRVRRVSSRSMLVRSALRHYSHILVSASASNHSVSSLTPYDCSERVRISVASARTMSAKADPLTNQHDFGEVDTLPGPGSTSKSCHRDRAAH
jgi:hypothetical protein